MSSISNSDIFLTLLSLTLLLSLSFCLSGGYGLSIPRLMGGSESRTTLHRRGGERRKGDKTSALSSNPKVITKTHHNFTRSDLCRRRGATRDRSEIRRTIFLVSTEYTAGGGFASEGPVDSLLCQEHAGGLAKRESTAVARDGGRRSSHQSCRDEKELAHIPICDVIARTGGVQFGSHQPRRVESPNGVRDRDLRCGP